MERKRERDCEKERESVWGRDRESEREREREYFGVPHLGVRVGTLRTSPLSVAVHRAHRSIKQEREGEGEGKREKVCVCEREKARNPLCLSLPCLSIPLSKSLSHTLSPYLADVAALSGSAPRAQVQRRLLESHLLSTFGIRPSPILISAFKSRAPGIGYRVCGIG